MSDFLENIKLNKTYSPSDIESLLKSFNYYVYERTKQPSYVDVICAFDTESTSTYIGEGKAKSKLGIMYGWSFCINGYTIIGRTYQELCEMLSYISDYYQLNTKRKLIVYVHNLAWDFQFIRKWFDWECVFCVDERKVVKAETKNNIEFRCSYLMSGKSLAKVAEDLQCIKMHKLYGDLDYNLIRHQQTPLTENEIAYMKEDVRIVSCLIFDKKKEKKYIYRIPLTSTGYVREYCKKKCYRDKEVKGYYDKFIKPNLIPSIANYNQLKRAFSGGFTHANYMYVGYTMKNVSSYDLTSDYPFQLVSKKYPYGKPNYIEITSYNEFLRYINEYCCLFDISFKNLRPKITYENYLSLHKCDVSEDVVTNNGRVVSASEVFTTMTDVDFRLCKEFYYWDGISIENFCFYRKKYLPTPLVKAILQLYKNKTEFKNVEGKEVDLMLSKQLLNSIYGMSVTDDIGRDELEYKNGEFTKQNPNLIENLRSYNKKQRVVWYPVGVWCTAYARETLLNAIINEVKEDYVYADTDSCKFLNNDKHKQWFEDYNKRVEEELKIVAEEHKLSIDYFMPKNKDGIPQMIGSFDSENSIDGTIAYYRFKSLGAKRYMYENKKGYSLVVSGLNKAVTMPYLLSKTDNPFKIFTNHLRVPPEYTGKKTHTYDDRGAIGEITDYLGNKGKYEERSFIHLESAEYNLKLSQRFIEFLSTFRVEKEQIC